MSRWFTIKYFDKEVEVTKEELENLYQAWNGDKIAIRKDGTSLSKNFVHILPSTSKHIEDYPIFKELPEPRIDKAQEEKKRERINKKWDEIRKKLIDEYGFNL